MSDISLLLRNINDGDAAARDELFALLYPELRRLARARLRRVETITLLDTTALLHESYLRFQKSHGLAFEDRGRFFAYAASVMHAVVVDEVRKRRAARRGGAAEHVELDEHVAGAAAQDGAHEEAQILRVHEALQDLGALDARLARVVEMRYFAGFTEQEIAGALGVTERTVRRDWDKARTMLFSALS